MSKSRRIYRVPPVVTFECPVCYGIISVEFDEGGPDILKDYCLCDRSRDAQLIALARHRLPRREPDVDCDGGGDGPDD